ncbi:MAG: hypothetical protein JWQ09_154 [Segetibacter sp.]|nr:hypothetical protein [Segetibacter sp.]
MEIQIGTHALLRAEERGATEKEIQEVLETGVPLIAKSDRLGKEKVFQFEQVLNGKYYKQKKITAIYTIENSIVIVITVIVKYGTF